MEIESIFKICMNVSYRTVVREINDLRRSACLIGNSSSSRYDYFINVLLKDRTYILKFYQKYSVLYELLDKRFLIIFGI